MKDKYIVIAFLVGYALGGINAYIWLKTHINPTISQQSSVEGYTLYKLCPDGKTAEQEISHDGSKIIHLGCQR